MDPVTVVGLVATIVQLIDATSTAIKYVNDVKDAPKDRATLAREGSSLLALFVDLRYRVEEADSTSSWFTGVRSLAVEGGPLDELKCVMEELARKLKPATGVKKFSKALIWTLDKKEISDILAKIERLKTLVSLALQKDQFKLSQAIKQNITEVREDMRKIQKDQETQNIINWISPLNFPIKQNDYFSRRHTGTGEWLLEDTTFKSWLDGPEKTLWCPGIPGAGKTILTSIVINYLEQRFDHHGVAIAYVYCNYKEHDDQTVVNLIASLLQQLAQRNLAISEDIMALYYRHIKKQTRPTLDELSKLLQSEARRFSKVFVLIDALDECLGSDGTRDSFIGEIRKLQLNTHLLVTSRPVLTIEREFEEAARLEIRASDEDVKRYLDSRINSEGRLLRLVKSDSVLQATITDTIVENAKGMFLLAQLHMDSLAKKSSRKDIRKALENLPKELDHTYDEAMQRIRSQDEDDTKVAEQVLSWLSFTFRPLTIIEIQHVLAVEPGDVDFDEDALLDEDVLVSVCAGLVTVDQESNVIRLVHHTTQEYFERTRMSLFPNAQTNIATSCLVYLSLDAFAESYCKNEKEIRARMRTYPFLEYAVQHWGNHGRGEAEESIKELALEFLQNKSKLMCATQVMQISDTAHLVFDDALFESMAGLHLVASLGLSKIVHLLLEREDVNINSKDSLGRTPLLLAVEGGHETVVQQLLEREDIDADSKDLQSQTPFWLASGNGHQSIVRLLLEHKGINVNFKDRHGRTPLSMAAETGHEAVVGFLLKHEGVDANSTDEYSRTPLLKAAGKGHKEVVQLLLEHNGVDADFKDDFGQTPLSRASEKGHEAVIRLLLDCNNINVNSKDKDGQAPLSWAAAGGYEPLVKLLLEQKDVDSDSKDEYGQTPLSRASEKGHEAVVRLLLDCNNINVNSKDKDGQTPLWWATVGGHKTVVTLLSQHAGVAEFGAADAALQDHPSPEKQEATSQNTLLDIDLDSVIDRLLEIRGSRPGKQVQLLQAEIYYLCRKAREIFLSQPMLLELNAPIKVAGDIRGQYPELLQIFEVGGYPPEANYLFLGNYVNRGKQPLETICLLLAYKIKYPENFFVLRGNYEIAAINRIYGFYDHCKRRYNNIRLWKIFNACFNCMPVAAIIEDKIFATHGGLSPDLISMEQIRRVRRPTDIPDCGLLCDLMWADPDGDINGWSENDRGFSWTFGPDIVSRFLQKYDMDMICRSRQIVEDGYEFFAGRQLVTLFSAANYIGEFDNHGAVMDVDKNLRISFHILKPALMEERRESAYRASI